jgi:predicted CXXCH cytochrome family protein
VKKLLVFAIAFLLLAGAAGAATIVGTKHDMTFAPGTYKGANNASNQVCIYCHTPHNALSALVPLWNHATTATASFTLYSSSTLNATLTQPAGASKACLSCHDGSVNVDAFGSNAGATKLPALNVNNLGTDLSNDHPVSFAYTAALVTADAGGGAAGLVVPASASQVVAGIPLFATNMECASCHDVHDNTNAPFLRASNAASALCLKCHIK